MCHPVSLLQGKWERKKYVGVSLVDKTLAIIGFGKVRLGAAHIAQHAAPGDTKILVSPDSAPARQGRSAVPAGDGHSGGLCQAEAPAAAELAHGCAHTHPDRPCCITQVGGEVARRARGLGMDVIAYDPYASEEKARAQVPGHGIVLSIEHWPAMHCTLSYTGIARLQGSYVWTHTA